MHAHMHAQSGGETSFSWSVEELVGELLMSSQGGLVTVWAVNTAGTLTSQCFCFNMFDSPLVVRVGKPLFQQRGILEFQ